MVMQNIIEDPLISAELAKKYYDLVENWIFQNAKDFVALGLKRGISRETVDPYRKGVSSGFHMAIIAIAKGQIDITELAAAYSAADARGPGADRRTE